MSVRTKLAFLAAGALATVGISSSADAAVFFTATFNGTVGSVDDVDNVFGGGNLRGAAFQATFSTSVPNWMVCGCATSVGVVGAPPPTPIDATLTINGHTQAFTAAAFGVFGLAYQDSSDGNLVAGVSVIDPDFGVEAIVQNYDLLSPILNGNFVTPVTYHVQQSDFTLGFFSLDANESGDLFPETIDVSAVTIPALPEPGSWAMMVLGIGAAGALLRRHHQIAVPAARHE
jgi:hypothetical protein